MSENLLAGRIAQLRKEAGMTQEQLGNALGLTYQSVSKWENGLSCPDVQLLPQLADLFHVTLDDLFGREAPQPQRTAEQEEAERTLPVAGRRYPVCGDVPRASAADGGPGGAEGPSGGAAVRVRRSGGECQQLVRRGV